MRKIINRIYLHNKLPEPLIKITISKKAIVKNYQQFKTMSGCRIAPVLKSNAYGHGLIEVANIVRDLDPPFVVVDSFYEAKMLRRSAISTPILVIGYSTFEQINVKLKKVSYAITSLRQLTELASYLKYDRVFHIKLDTGMHRQGLLDAELDEALQLILSNKHIIVEGICSHFADADNEDAGFTTEQINHWNSASAAMKQKIHSIKYCHIAASAGSRYFKLIDANIIRLGIGLYGINPTTKLRLNLEPALSMQTSIAAIKMLNAGHGIGYNLTHTAKTDGRIAIIPAGYYEGIDRRLSNKGSVTIGGKQCPIVGRICMNICMADVSKIGDRNLDEAVIISSNPEHPNCIENLAKICQTNPHELLVHIPAHLRRDVI